MSAHDELFAAAAAPHMLGVFGDCGRFVYEPKSGRGQVRSRPLAAVVHDEFTVRENGDPPKIKRTRIVEVSAADCIATGDERPKVNDWFLIDDEHRYAIEEIIGPGGDGMLTLRGVYAGVVERTRPDYRKQ